MCLANLANLANLSLVEVLTLPHGCGNLCVLHDVVRCVVRGASGRVFTLASYGFQRVFSVSVLTLFLQFYMLSVFYTFLLAVSSPGGSTEL